MAEHYLRKELYQTATENEELFEQIAENVGEILFVVDQLDYKVLYVNPAYEKTWGRTLESLYKHPTSWVEAIVPEDRERVKAALERQQQTGEFREEFRITRPDQSIRWIRDRVFPIRNSQGETYRLVGIAEDITERRSLQEQLLQSQKQLKESNEQLEVRVTERTAELRDAIAEITELKERLDAENLYLREEILSDHDFEEVVGTSQALRSTLRDVERVAPTLSNVLILGETGTGKELIARAVHNRSDRRARALVKVNCSAIPDTLMESEFFGHEKGAFTGALDRKMGRFELANGGTMFLDEIGDLPLDLQAKLLRVLQDGEFERLGSTKTTKVDVRIIAATNHDLQSEVAAGAFRSDLFYRLNVFPIQVPALRERIEDIPLLAWFFISSKQSRFKKRIDKVPVDVMESMQRYSWPGNVRELENVIERALILSPDDVLVIDGSLGAAADPPSPPSLRQDLEQVEREHILSVLGECGWKVKGRNNAAEVLGLNESTLRSRMKKLSIQKPAQRSKT